MNSGISKKRQKHISNLADKHNGAGEKNQGFKNSTFLACIYAFIVGAVAILAMLITLHSNDIDFSDRASGPVREIFMYDP